jgi:hypothetical protein
MFRTPSVIIAIERLELPKTLSRDLLPGAIVRDNSRRVRSNEFPQLAAGDNCEIAIESQRGCDAVVAVTLWKDTLGWTHKTKLADEINCRVCQRNDAKRRKSHKPLAALLDFQFKIAKSLACAGAGQVNHARSKVYAIHFFLSDAHTRRVVSFLL